MKFQHWNELRFFWNKYFDFIDWISDILTSLNWFILVVVGVNFTNVFCSHFCTNVFFLVMFCFIRTKNTIKKRWWNWPQLFKFFLVWSKSSEPKIFFSLTKVQSIFKIICVCTTFGYLYFSFFSIIKWTSIGCRKWSWHGFDTISILYWMIIEPTAFQRFNLSSRHSLLMSIETNTIVLPES